MISTGRIKGKNWHFLNPLQTFSTKPFFILEPQSTKITIVIFVEWEWEWELITVDSFQQKGKHDAL